MLGAPRLTTLSLRLLRLPRPLLYLTRLGALLLFACKSLRLLAGEMLSLPVATALCGFLLHVQRCAT